MLGKPDYDASGQADALAWYEQHGLINKLIQSDERGGFDSTKVDEIIRKHTHAMTGRKRQQPLDIHRGADVYSHESRQGPTR